MNSVLDKVLKYPFGIYNEGGAEWYILGIWIFESHSHEPIWYSYIYILYIYIFFFLGDLGVP